MPFCRVSCNNLMAKSKTPMTPIMMTIKKKVVNMRILMFYRLDRVDVQQYFLQARQANQECDAVHWPTHLDRLTCNVMSKTACFYCLESRYLFYHRMGSKCCFFQ